MEASFDVFLTCLPRDVSEVVIRNLFKTVGNVTKVKIIDDKKNENYKLCFVGFTSMDEAMEAVRLGDRSTAFGEPIKASISRKSLEGYDSQKSTQPNNDFKKSTFNNTAENTSPRGVNNVGRGRGMQPKHESSGPSFACKSTTLSDIKLKSKELIDVEIVDLTNLECICVRPLKNTENSKVEITDLLVKVNTSAENLREVESPNVGDCYLGKWDDGQYYRAELLEIRSDGKFKVTFVDEGTSGDIITEIKLIPEGPLQQYPKQFTKITLGCKNSDDLRTYIINESDGKKVSIYWLGGYINNIPLINLFLSEEEVVEKFILAKKFHVRDIFAISFKDVQNHTPETNFSHVTLIQQMYKNQSEFTVQINEPSTIKCQKKTPLILPVPLDFCIYEKRNGANIMYSRCVIKRRQLFSFDILLFDNGETLTNVSIDSLYAAEDCHKTIPPHSIICEHDISLGYSEDAFKKIMMDENLKFTIKSYKGYNRYMVSAVVNEKEIRRYPDNITKNLVGQINRVQVTHVVSPINFFVQVDKPEYIESLNNIHMKLNAGYKGHSFNNIDSINIGQAVVAPFSIDDGEGENFRATVIETRKQAPHVHVYYIDYGNDSWVDYKQLIDVDNDIINRPGLAFNCTLNVDIKKEANNHAIELFSKLTGFTDNDNSDLIMNVINDHDGKLTVDLTSEVKGSISVALDKSGTCCIKKDCNNMDSKPMCNGDSVRSPLQNSEIKTNDHKSSSQVSRNVQDYEFIIKRIDELEQRLACLEKRNAHN